MKGTKPSMKTDNSAIRSVKPPPKWMSADSKAEWKKVFPSLVERRILTVADLGSLEHYCIAVGTVREMERKLQAEGYVFVGENGLKRHPATVVRSEAMTQARLLAAELGLTPVSRSRPAIRDDDEKDDDDNPLNIS